MAGRTFYRDRKILITGLTGFKGIWLGLWLKQLGARVEGLGLPPAPQMRHGWPDLETRMPCRHGEICDLPYVKNVFREVQPEIVFHMAAQPLVRKSYADPVGTYATNVMGTAHVLEAARGTGSVQATVVITTDKCYENREWDWGYREADPVGGYDPYSSSKACAELLVASYRRAFSDQAACRQAATARAGNVIGGGDWAEDRLVPDMVRSVCAEEAIHLRRPTALRPWQHVLEPLSGYLLLARALAEDRPGSASAWNFGPIDPQPMTVRDFAHQFVQLWGRGTVTEADEETGPHEARFLKLDSSKAVSRLGWQPLLAPQERLQWTVDWYKRRQEQPDTIWDFTRFQIELMEERIRQCAGFDRAWHGDLPLSRAA